MKENRTFEQSMTLLEEIVAKLENQDTPLEEAMELFRQGVELSDECAQKLEQAKQSVSVLIEKNGVMTKEEFASDEE
ncbi:MAG: exodeoxyribonuclease VII small subunit [Clostridia bacterium]|nr:exodeoxyribonuclease VII small subunit [Clostridia bacterium]